MKDKSQPLMFKTSISKSK